MNNFRLIAITPLTGCSDKFSKNLALGTSFQFYYNYKILLDTKRENILKVSSAQRKNEVKELYQLNNGIAVDFSAVVGKNGTGKSTLFELFYYAIYLMGTRSWHNQTPFLEKSYQHMEYQNKQMGNDWKKLVDAVSKLETLSVDDRMAEQERQINLYTLELIQKYDIHINTFRTDSFYGICRIVAAELRTKMSDLDNQINIEKEREKLLEEGFNVSIVYEADSEIMELNCFNGKIEHYKFDKRREGLKSKVDSFNLKTFFYTISLNYSHHSLNSKNLGLWINKLFHKNDAYITPLVINPMRNEGNFNINDELKLSRERLASTLVYDLVRGDRNLLLNKYEVTKYIYVPKLMPESDKMDELSKKMLFQKTGNTFVNDDVPYRNLALTYLQRKIQKTHKNYNFLLPEDASFEEFILRHESHLTRKIIQTVNYLKVSSSKIHKKIWEQAGGSGIIELTPEQLKEYLSLFGDMKNVSAEDIIKFALPAFFNIDFEFDHKIKLSELSSGEQQAVFNINSILYHLYNIQSVHHEGNIGEAETNSIKPGRTAYRNVNIVLDEVELYYHPEMQRELVKNLMDAFENLKPNGGIKGINVCILTHSPFILSDIPTVNVLALERSTNGYSTPKEKQEESFAANISDLLEDKFFLEGTLVGEYAAQKIDLLIDRINNGTTRPEDDKLIELIGDPYLQASLKIFKDSHD